MSQDAKEIVIPDYTFGINRVFGEAFNSGWRAFPGHYLLYASTGTFQLAKPDTKVISVVVAVGFSSVSAFNRAFREFAGETPSSYRKRLQPMS